MALNKEDGGNRKFILVECEDYADTITAERVRRVINGVPGAKDASLKEGLGGSFTYCTLGDPIDVEGMLTGEALPGYSELASYLLHTASGLSLNGELKAQNDDGLFYSNGDTDYYLLYRPDMEWLRSNEAILNAEAGPADPRSGQKGGGVRLRQVYGPAVPEGHGQSPSARFPTNCTGKARGGQMELKNYQTRTLDAFTRWRALDPR